MVFKNLTRIGKLKHIKSSEIKDSGVSVGFECLDRFIFDPEKCYDKLAAIGVKWARCQTGWCRCEKEKGVYDFQWLDDVVDNLLKRGVQPWFNVGFGNKLYMPDAYGEAAVGHVPLYYGEEALNAWKSYISALAKHFSTRVKFWEIWNEPDCKSFWQPGEADPVEYARLARITAPLIREQVPGADIGICTSVVFNPPYTAALVRSGIAKEIDTFAVHVYRIQPELKNSASDLDSLRRLLDANGGSHVRIIQGEAGYASWFPENHWMQPYVLESEESQAKWLLRRYATDFAAKLPISSFFQMVDIAKPYQKGCDELKAPARHGLLNGNSYTPKMSYHAMGNIAAVFDCDTTLEPLYFQIKTDSEMPKSERISRLLNVSFAAHGFMRKGRPLYLYYLPEDMQLGWTGLSDVSLEVFPTERGTGITAPVLVNLLEGTIFKLKDFDMQDGFVSKIRGVPLTDYPLLLTDIDALAGRIEIG